MSTASKARRANDLGALARDERLYRMVMIKADGSLRRGPVLRALEAYGWQLAAARMADVSGERCEAHEVAVCELPTKQRTPPRLNSSSGPSRPNEKLCTVSIYDGGILSRVVFIAEPLELAAEFCKQFNKLNRSNSLMAAYLPLAGFGGDR